jgi:hypothetical protein
VAKICFRIPEWYYNLEDDEDRVDKLDEVIKNYEENGWDWDIAYEASSDITGKLVVLHPCGERINLEACIKILDKPLKMFDGEQLFALDVLEYMNLLYFRGDAPYSEINSWEHDRKIECEYE